MQLGGLLADFWRGAPDPAWRERVREGVALHRKIDGHTDRHPSVARLRRLFAPPFRRYAGILLDIYFDHALARYWPDYSSEAIDAVSVRALCLIDANRDWLPPALARFAAYMRANGLFAAYAQRETIDQVLAGLGRRLARANPLAEAGRTLWENAAALDAGFAAFMPELAAFAAEQRGLPSR